MGLIFLNECNKRTEVMVQNWISYFTLIVLVGKKCSDTELSFKDKEDVLFFLFFCDRAKARKHIVQTLNLQ